MRFAQLSCRSRRPAKYGGAFAPFQKSPSSLLDSQQMHRFLDHPQDLRGASNDDALVKLAQASAARRRRAARAPPVQALDQRDLVLALVRHDGLTRNLFQGLAALGRDLIGRENKRQSADGGAHHIDGIARTVALRKHVTHPRTLQHCAHTATGDDARTVRRGLHVDARCAMKSLDRVMQRIVSQRYGNHVLASLGHRLGDRDGHLACFTEAVADAARAIPHDGQGREAELTTAFDDLRRAIDRDELLYKLIRRSAFFRSRHVHYLFCRTWPSASSKPLKLPPRFASGVRKRLHAPVELETSTVESNLSHPLGLCPLGDGTATGLGGFAVASSLQTVAHLLLDRGRRGNYLRARSIRHLRINVLRGAMHGQPRNSKIADVSSRLYIVPQTAFLLGLNYLNGLWLYFSAGQNAQPEGFWPPVR